MVTTWRDQQLFQIRFQFLKLESGARLFHQMARAHYRWRGLAPRRGARDVRPSARDSTPDAPFSVIIDTSSTQTSPHHSSLPSHTPSPEPNNPTHIPRQPPTHPHSHHPQVHTSFIPTTDHHLTYNLLPHHHPPPSSTSPTATTMTPTPTILIHNMSPTVTLLHHQP